MLQRVYKAWNVKLKPCGFISWKNFKVRTARDRQLYKRPTRVIQGIISLILTFRVITQFDIRSHHYTACVYSMEREIQTMRIYFLEKFQSADSARSTALQRAYKGNQRYNPYTFHFPRYNSVWYSFSPLYSVCIKHGTGNSNHADFFPGRISKGGQRAIDSSTEGLQGPPMI